MIWGGYNEGGKIKSIVIIKKNRVSFTQTLLVRDDD
jgi:hypothetical protein